MFESLFLLSAPTEEKEKIDKVPNFFIFFPLFIHCAIENERKTSNCKKQTREEKKN